MTHVSGDRHVWQIGVGIFPVDTCVAEWALPRHTPVTPKPGVWLWQKPEQGWDSPTCLGSPPCRTSPKVKDAGTKARPDGTGLVTMTKISRAGWDLSYLPYPSGCNQEPEEPQGTPESPACRQLDPPQGGRWGGSSCGCEDGGWGETTCPSFLAPHGVMVSQSVGCPVVSLDFPVLPTCTF